MDFCFKCVSGTQVGSSECHWSQESYLVWDISSTPASLHSTPATSVHVSQSQWSSLPNITATSFHRSPPWCVTSGWLPSPLGAPWGGLRSPYFCLAESDTCGCEQGQGWGKIRGGKIDRNIKRPKKIICTFTAMAPPLQEKTPYFRLHMVQFTL